ncbi:MotB1 [Nitrospina gracilis 3/211]|uniref:MotB1 n=1 Tax=Nitrospina gracilis (strain 3/211) TaxID=1266370 RepID=M1Z2L6_NITG3|nr:MULTISPECIES: flagellar motor protein MotB [Nitrospina]MCF8724721.1 chemotaxis protein MotB [Nitrospina sp. Nb-3]CCQ91993.1 MotB1 [Nitrospina gracilis 3/211]
MGTKPSGQPPTPDLHLDDEEEVMEETTGVAPWVITFADMVTLLMVFFILLYAMGSIEEEKFRQIRESLRSALGTEQLPELGTREGLDVIKDLATAQMDDQTIHAVDEVGAMVSKEIKEITSEVEDFIYKNKLSGQVQVSQGERGAIITISDVVLFPPGKARMTYKGRETLKDVFDLLKQFNYDVKIEGHTDDTPIRTDRFPSNWELSSGRAAEVARMLIAEGFPPEKLSVEGFAEYRPKVPNTSAKNRAINRRIEIVYQRGSIRKRMVNLLNR